MKKIPVSRDQRQPGGNSFDKLHAGGVQAGSDPPGSIRPEQGVELELQADVEAVIEQQMGQDPRFEQGPDRRKEHGRPLVEPFPLNLLPRPVEVVHRAENEFDFVPALPTASLPEHLDILRKGMCRHARSRTFDIHDNADRIRHRVKRQAAVGFEQHLAAGRDQCLHQRIDRCLRQRFAAGDLDQDARRAIRPGENIGKRHGGGRFLPGIAGIAVGAAQVAARQPDKQAGQAGPGRLALDGIKQLRDPQGFSHRNRPRRWSRFRRPRRCAAHTARCAGAP